MGQIRTDILPGDVLVIGDVRVSVERKGGRRSRVIATFPDGTEVVKIASEETESEGFADAKFPVPQP